MVESLFTVGEVAERLRLNPVTIQRWIRDGRLSAINLGGSAGYRIRAEDIEHLLFQEYGRIESLARRAAAAESELAEALGDYARGLTGATEQNVLTWRQETLRVSQENLLRAEHFKDVKWFYRPRQPERLAAERAHVTKLVFNAEDQEMPGRLDFASSPLVRIRVQPRGDCGYWRLGLEFSRDLAFSGWRYGLDHPLWHLTKNDAGSRLARDYYDRYRKSAPTVSVIEPYDNDAVVIEIVASTRVSRMDIKVAGQPGYEQAFALYEHRYARLFAWADGRSYELDVEVELVQV